MTDRPAPTDEHPRTQPPEVHGAPAVVDVRETPPLPHALLREAYDERLHLLARGAGDDDLAASALRIQDLETALRPTRRLPRRTTEPSIFLG